MGCNLKKCDNNGSDESDSDGSDDVDGGYSNKPQQPGNDSPDSCTSDERDACCDQSPDLSSEDRQDMCKELGCNLNKCSNNGNGDNGGYDPDYGDHYEQKVTEDCERKELDKDDPSVCVEVCTTLTKIYGNGVLKEESVKTTQRRCGND